MARRDPVERVLEHMEQLRRVAYDPILNPTPNAAPRTITTYDPNSIFDENFGQPASGDGK